MIYLALSVVGIVGLLSYVILAPIYRDLRRKNEFRRLLQVLELTPVDPSAHAEFLMVAEVRYLQDRELAQMAYKKALEIVRAHPGNEAAEQFALDVGRWYYRLSRPDGELLYPDELAIQLDIDSRPG